MHSLLQLSRDSPVILYLAFSRMKFEANLGCSQGILVYPFFSFSLSERSADMTEIVLASNLSIQSIGQVKSRYPSDLWASALTWNSWILLT